MRGRPLLCKRTSFIDGPNHQLEISVVRRCLASASCCRVPASACQGAADRTRAKQMTFGNTACFAGLSASRVYSDKRLIYLVFDVIKKTYFWHLNLE